MRKKVKVTVLKRLSPKDVFGDNVPPEATLNPEDICPRFTEGQEFVIEQAAIVPEGFCGWAYSDIQRDIIHLAFGGDFPWMKKQGFQIACCTDGMRPVIFQLESLD